MVVGEQQDFLLLVLIPDYYSPKRIGTDFLGIKSSKPNELIGYDVSGGGNRTIFHHPIIGVFL